MTDSTMVWGWPVPDIHEINRALEFIGLVNQRDYDYACSEYAKRHTTAHHGELPCFAKDTPDTALLTALRALWRLQNNCQRLGHEL